MLVGVILFILIMLNLGNKRVVFIHVKLNKLRYQMPKLMFWDHTTSLTVLQDSYKLDFQYLYP